MRLPVMGWLGVVFGLVAWIAHRGGGAEAGGNGAPPALPAYRVDAQGFDASAADIRAVCDSAGRELWRYFPDYQVEPFVVTRGREGPIILHQRNDRGEVVMRLDTGNTYWSQYAYQFAHEFCHLLCGFDDDARQNLWFEETLCETASLFAIRAMARSWKDDPPYANWRDYRDSLRNYADDSINSRQRVLDIYRRGMAGFYATHREALEREPCDRDLNGAMAVVLLSYFEQQPERWEAVRWLNSSPSPKGETFERYLQKWHDAAPPRHQDFVRTLADLYGVAPGIGETEQAGPR